MDSWALFFHDLGTLNEVSCVVVVFRHTCGDSQNVQVENDVFFGEVNLSCEDIVGSLADIDLALDAVGLAFFIKCHDDG